MRKKQKSSTTIKIRNHFQTHKKQPYQILKHDKFVFN
jgi:hypothetical protein